MVACENLWIKFTALLVAVALDSAETVFLQPPYNQLCVLLCWLVLFPWLKHLQTGGQAEQLIKRHRMQDADSSEAILQNLLSVQLLNIILHCCIIHG